jgi:hypothetical protein
MDKADPNKMKEVMNVVQNKNLAALMLSGANQDNYRELKCSMSENYVIGTNNYPDRPEIVLRILSVSVYTPPPGWNKCLKQDAGGGDKGAMCNQLD